MVVLPEQSLGVLHISCSAPLQVPFSQSCDVQSEFARHTFPDWPTRQTKTQSGGEPQSESFVHAAPPDAHVPVAGQMCDPQPCGNCGAQRWPAVPIAHFPLEQFPDVHSEFVISPSRMPVSAAPVDAPLRPAQMPEVFRRLVSLAVATKAIIDRADETLASNGREPTLIQR